MESDKKTFSTGFVIEIDHLFTHCFVGDIDRVKTYIFNHSNDECDLNVGLDGACIGGFINVARLLISHAKKIGKPIDLNRGFNSAVIENKIEMVHFMISQIKEAGERVVWDEGFLNAQHYKNLELLHLFISRGAQMIMKYDWEKDHDTIVKLLYLGTPLLKFSECYGYQNLVAHISKVKESIVKSNAVLKDLLSIVSSFIIV